MKSVHIIQVRLFRCGLLATVALAYVPLVTGQQQCSVKSFDYPAKLSKCQTLELLGGRAKTLQSFQMQAGFNAPAKECEYRQGVKGVFQFKEKNKPAVTIPHPLSPPGMDQIMLSETKLQEDGTDDPGQNNNLHFGHRMQGRNTEDDTYDMPNRLTGSRYRGKDEPGIRYDLDDIKNGIEDKFQLHFVGTIIDVGTGKPVLGTIKNWDVQCSNLTTPPPGDDQDEMMGAFDDGIGECNPLKQAEVGTTLSDGTPVVVALSVCEQTPDELTGVVSIANGVGEYPIYASDVSLQVTDEWSELSLLEGPSGILRETVLESSDAFGVYWFDFSISNNHLFVQLSVRGAYVQFPLILQEGR